MEDGVALPVTEHIRHAFGREAVVDFLEQSPKVVFEDGQVADALAGLPAHRVVSSGQEVGRVSDHAVHAAYRWQHFAAVARALG